MSLPRYPEYKGSGVAWLGYVPEHWPVKRFKWLIERNDGGAWGDDPDGEDDTIVMRSTEQSVDGEWKLDDPAFRKLSPSERNGATLEVGDLLVTKSSGSAFHIGKTTLVDDRVAELRCCFSNFMQRLRLNSGLLPKLAWYVMNNELARRQFDFASNSTTGLANLNGTMISQVLLPVPKTAEQAAIVAFLDRETAKIDALISEQEKLIALLAEKRQATISHAVTKGLNPNAPMKDSGVPWLGEVPAHWGVAPLMYLTHPARPIMYGIVLPGPNVEGGVPIVKGGDVKEHRLKIGLLNRTTAEIEAPFARARLNPLDIVYSIRGTIGDAEVVPDELEGANITQDVARVSPDKGIQTRWLLHVMKARPVFVQLEQRSLGAAVRGINIFELKRARIPVPPSEERDAIAAFLDAETSKLDELQSEAACAIQLLKERRSALIAAAVTGQIDVRGVEA